jgi:hypothetical protein
MGSKEDLLGHVFACLAMAQPTVYDGVHDTEIALDKLLEGSRVSSLGGRDQLCVRRLCVNRSHSFSYLLLARDLSLAHKRKTNIAHKNCSLFV